MSVHFLNALYNLSVALWTGGASLFTFIVTPVVFKSQERDTAGMVVSQIFPYYFIYNLALSGAALFFFSLEDGAGAGRLYTSSLVLLVSAVAVNIFIVVFLYPRMEKIKQEIRSFQDTSPDLTARISFRRLHGVSAALNFYIMLVGVILIFLNGFRAV